MKTVNQKDSSLLQDRFLFVGTSEQIAKNAPNKGLPPLITLTDVYTGFFCKQSCKNEERWGIISISLSELRIDMLAPSLDYLDRFSKNKTTTTVEERYERLFANIGNYSSKWDKSLEVTGTCIYLAQVPPSAIKKVMIYTPSGRDGNVIINDYVNKMSNPAKESPANHKINYKKNLGISRWLSGENVKGEDIKDQADCDFENKLANRYGLDAYYIKPIEKGKKHVAAKKS